MKNLQNSKNIRKHLDFLKGAKPKRTYQIEILNNKIKYWEQKFKESTYEESI